MGKHKHKHKNTRFVDYSYGVCDICGNFLTDCTCNSRKISKNMRNTLYCDDNYYDEGICPECLQDVDSCLCAYTEEDGDVYFDYTDNTYVSNRQDIHIQNIHNYEFKNYADLFTKIPNHKYDIEYNDVDSKISIISPHGGNIEKGTTEIAKTIASDTYNFYSFKGVDDNSEYLHITSHRFDEPICLEIAEKSEYVITIHGCYENYDIVYIGGLAIEFKAIIAKRLLESGISTKIQDHRFLGTHPRNICNRGITKTGVQIELSSSIRCDKIKLKKVSAVLRDSITAFSTQMV